ncbi:hypothetical protein EDC01DRAFT_643764 [Geopyxis carbonaria]|nr:hypothetical protein EDC01DRAFT_643764 [Geopyxis carbonaria]
MFRFWFWCLLFSDLRLRVTEEIWCLFLLAVLESSSTALEGPDAVSNRRLKQRLLDGTWISLWLWSFSVYYAQIFEFQR